MGAMQTDTTVLIHDNEAISADFVTQDIDVQQMEGFSFQLIWDNGSTFNATATIEGSNDLKQAKSYITVDRSSEKLNQDDGTHIYDASNFHYRYMRLKITITTGSADFDIYFNSRSRRN